MEAEFEAAVKKAAPIFQRAKGCHGMELRRSIEKPSRYRLFVNWETLEDHTVGFRNSPEFQEWRRTRRPLLRLAAGGRARAAGGARLLKPAPRRKLEDRRDTAALPSSDGLRPILGSWRKAPIDRARRRGAIRPSIRKKTRPSRPAPRRRGRTRRTLDPALAELLNPAIGRGRAGVGSQTGIEPEARAESSLPSPLRGRVGGGSEANLKRRRLHRSIRQPDVTPPDPHP